jgi:lipopolysaccharide transport system ATP-binding protein
MSEFVLQAEGLSKRYQIQKNVGYWHRNQRVLVDDIMQFARQIGGEKISDKKVSFWALKDVSFTVNPGDVIGVIGRNGAGKSTLLKLLGRVISPTSGRAILYGRIGSLLEVGTGFHSELTGRENIYISGAVIGMSRAEIKQKFDEIVAFSGVEAFLDTPVKRFSSGMEVRLAFSVAAHLNPQILLVDEVLSVGDASFQQKSLQKISEVSNNGGAILFVSHNMTTVASMCSQAMVLEQGKVSFPLGPVTGAIEHYLTNIAQDQAARLELGRQGSTPGSIKITGFSLLGADGTLVETLTSGLPVHFKLDYESGKTTHLDQLNISILIKTLKGDVIANLNNQSVSGPLTLPSGSGQVICSLPKLPLAPGNISITLIIEQKGLILDKINDAYIGVVDKGGHLQENAREGQTGWLLVDQDWSVSNS